MEKGIDSLTIDQLNNYLKNVNQEKITPELLKLMFDENEGLQRLITNISGNKIQLAKKQ